MNAHFAPPAWNFESSVLSGDSDDPDHRSDLMPISLPKEADQVVRSEATLGF